MRVLFLCFMKAVRNGRQEGFMDQHTVVSLGRNLGLALVCLALDDPAALDQSSEPSQPASMINSSSFDGGSGSRCLNGLGMKNKGSTRQHTDPTHFLRHLVRVGRFILGKPQSRNSDGHFVAVHVRLKPAFASEGSAQAKSQQRGRRRRGRPSNKDKDGLSAVGQHESVSEWPVEAYEWFLVDSTRLRPVPYPTLLALLRSLFGTKGWGNHGVLPVLITPLIFSKPTLKNMMAHLARLGDIMEALPADWCEPSSEATHAASTHANDSNAAAASEERKVHESIEENKSSSSGSSVKQMMKSNNDDPTSPNPPLLPQSPPSSLGAAEVATTAAAAAAAAAAEGSLRTCFQESLPLCPLSSYVLNLPPLERCEVALFLADRLAAPVHGLTVTAAVDLFAGQRRLSQFGVAHQVIPQWFDEQHACDLQNF